MELYRFLCPLPTSFLGIERGYANGYVAVPPEHPLYGKHYDDIDGVIVHGGLTYSDNYRNQFPSIIFFDGEIPEGYWVFGSDTCHFGDNAENCNRDYCFQQVTSLKEQLEQWQNTI